MKPKTALNIIGIAALIHHTDEAIVDTCHRLIEYVDDRVYRKIIQPIAESDNPSMVVSIYLEGVHVGHPKLKVGRVYHLDRIYDVYVEDQLFDPLDLFEEITILFNRRGVTSGNIVISVKNPLTRKEHITHVNMGTKSSEYYQNATQRYVYESIPYLE